jgi:hypothetical protein
MAISRGGQSGGGRLREHRWHHDERRRNLGHKAHLQAFWSLLEHLYIRLLIARHWPMVELRKPGSKSKNPKAPAATWALDGSF